MYTKPIETSITILAPDGVDIPAIYISSTSKENYGALLLHGITTHKDEFANFYKDLASALASMGISTLRIDFRGHGDSVVDSRQFSITSQIIDTYSAIKWMYSKVGQKVNLIGTSFGAPPAIFSAYEMPEQISTLNLICPVLNYEETFLKPTTEWGQDIFSSEAINNAFSKGFLQMNENFKIDVKLLVEMSICKPYDVLAQITSPTLLIHGKSDSIVPYKLSEKHSRYLNHVKFVGVSKMDHGFNDENDEVGDSEQSRKNYDFIVESIVQNIKRPT